jgi:hypothetical protein
MIIGPLIGRGLCYFGGTPYQNEFDQTVYPPNKWLFLVTGIIFALAIIPVIWMIKTEKKIKKVEQNDKVVDFTVEE